jgi:hypothetical protein
MRIPRFGTRADREIRALLHEFPQWQVSKTGGGHIRLRSPAGKVVVASATSNGWHVWPQVWTRMRRAERGGRP